MIKHKSYLADCGGAPALHVDGKPLFLDASCFPQTPPAAAETPATGIYFVQDGPFVVREDGTPDITRVQEQVVAILDREPEAFLIVRSFPPAPAWWLDAHPADEMRFDVDLRKYPGYEKYRDVSWGSEIWLKECSRWYAVWCRQLHRRFKGRIIGYQFGLGRCGENNPLGACTGDGRWFCSDFSPAMLGYFRRWLIRKYRNVRALRKAWSDPKVSFETVEIPRRLERLRTDWYTFRSPQKAQVADYYQALAERVEELVIAFCTAIKRATHNECIAGSHLGALLDNGLHGYIYHQACINALRHALAHPAVDTFSSPASYINRDPGGDANSMMPTGSIALHGKLVFQDQDTRTCVLPPGYRERFTLGRIAADMPQTIGVLKRDFAHMLIRGYGLWWHAIVPGMYDHPDIVACLAKLSAIGKRSMLFPRGPAEGLAMIVDEESVFHQECANRLFYPMLYYQRQHYWNRSGVAWNVFLHNDLAHPSLPDQKVYYFLNTFYLSSAEVEVIEKKVKRNNAIVIWTYAPGIQSPTGISLERVEQLTGFKLASVDVQALPRISLTNLAHPFVQYQPTADDDPYTRGDLPPGSFGVGPMGNDSREGIMAPIIYVHDPEAEVLGELDCLQEPGFCVKPMDGWTSVFCAAPMLNQYILRNIARSAGLPVFSEQDDILLPGRSFIMLHARTAGEKVIRLSQPADVYECYEGRELGRGVSEFRDVLPQYGTGLYFIGDLNRWNESNLD